VIPTRIKTLCTSGAGGMCINERHGRVRTVAATGAGWGTPRLASDAFAVSVSGCGLHYVLTKASWPGASTGVGAGLVFGCLALESRLSQVSACAGRPVGGRIRIRSETRVSFWIECASFGSCTEGGRLAVSEPLRLLPSDFCPR